MKKKTMKSIGVALQAILLGLMFLPQGKTTGEGSVNAFQLLDLSTAAGHPGDSLFYFVTGCGLPMVIILCILVIKDKTNFGAAAILTAVYSVAVACFYAAARRYLSAYLTFHYVYIAFIILGVISVLAYILFYFFSTPKEDP